MYACSHILSKIIARWWFLKISKYVYEHTKKRKKEKEFPRRVIIKDVENISLLKDENATGNSSHKS